MVLRARSQRAHERAITATYGLTGAGYADLLARQGGRCAICQVANGKARRLAVDHDHATGRVRGLLCGRCNHELLGRYDVAALRRALSYLLDPPAGH